MFMENVSTSQPTFINCQVKHNGHLTYPLFRILVLCEVSHVDYIKLSHLSIIFNESSSFHDHQKCCYVLLGSFDQIIHCCSLKMSFMSLPPDLTREIPLLHVVSLQSPDTPTCICVSLKLLDEIFSCFLFYPTLQIS